MRSKAFAASVVYRALGPVCLSVIAFIATGCGGGNTGGKFVTKTNPTISWANPNGIVYGTALGSKQLDATASVVGTFTYSPASGTVLNAGKGQTLSVSFAPSDTTDYNDASASVLINVDQAVSIIAWSDPANIVYGTPLGSAQLNATSPVAGTFAYSPALGTVLTAGKAQTLSATFTPTDAVDYATVTKKVTINVDQAVPPINWTTPAPVTVGTKLSSAQLDATSSVSGAFAYTPPAGTVMTKAGSQTLLAAFTPNDAVDFTSATASVKITVKPAAPAQPTITGLTPRYVAMDWFNLIFTNYSFATAGSENGDILNDASGRFGSLPLSLSSGQTSFVVGVRWQQGFFEPGFSPIWEIQHPDGSYGNQWATAFLGSGSQSTLFASPTTGTLFENDEITGSIYMLATDGTTTVLQGKTAISPIVMAADDVGNIIRIITGVVYSSSDAVPPSVAVNDETGLIECGLNPNVSYISSGAAMGGSLVFTMPYSNLVGFASEVSDYQGNCSGYQTVSLPGQPWAVAMMELGTELDALVLSRDKSSPNGLPTLTKFVISGNTVVNAGSVELTGFTPVSTVRTANLNAGSYQIQVFNQGPAAGTAAVLSTSDGLVLTISTDTSNGKNMAITNSIAVPEIPIGIAVRDGSLKSTLMVSYILANVGEAVTHIGAIDPVSGKYTPGVGACQKGLLAGGFIATSTGAACAQGSTIQVIPSL